MEKKIRETETIARTIKVDNAVDTAAKHRISAEVETHQGALQSINNGRIAGLDGKELASFQLFGMNQMTLTFHENVTDRAALLQEAENFMTDIMAIDWSEK